MPTPSNSHAGASAGLTSLNQLKAARYNPRSISAKAARGLKLSLETFGDLSGITWNQRTGNLIAGHQRVSELRAAGAEIHTSSLGPVIVLGIERFNVRIVDWDLTFEKLANIQANNPHAAGEFNDQLAALVDDVRNSAPDLGFALTGFDALALSAETGDANEGRIQNERNPHAVVIQYGLIFDTGEQKRNWHQFLERLAAQYGGGTQGENLSKWLASEQGIGA